MSFSFMDFAAAQTAGKQINADLQAKRDESAMRQQSLESQKFQMAQQMKQQESAQAFEQQRQAIVQDYDTTLKQQQIDSGALPDEQKQQAAQQEVEMYRKVGTAALTSNPEMAKQYFQLADTAQAKLTQTQKTNLEITEKKVKDTAGFAGTVLEGAVSPQEAFDWVKSNVGLKEAMAIPTDPVKAKLYWKSKQTQGLSAKEQVDNKIKLTEFQQKREDAARDHADLQADRLIRRQELANAREQTLELRKQTMDLRTKQYEEGGAIQRRQTIAAVNYANEAARGLDLVATMGAGQTASVFGHLQDGTTILKALESTGTNKLTPELQQIYQTSTKGLGLELAQLATAGSGRAPVKDLINEMSAMVEAHSGDKEFEIMFKLANAADFAKTRLEAVPASPDPKIQAIREKAEAALARYPHPKEIIALANRKGVKLGKAQSFTESLRAKLDKTLGKAGDGTDHPSDISDILNKYK
jgi:hypothetical protein